VIEAGSSPGASDIASFDTGASGTSLTVNGVPAATYYVRVRAKNAAGLSAASNEIALIVGGGPAPCSAAPAAPTNFTASASGSTVTLTWTASGGATSYIVEAGASPGSSALANIDVGGTTSFSSASVPSGTYYLRVRAKNSCGTSGPTNEVALSVGPPAPLLLTPESELLVPQSGSSTGCAFHPTRGYGLRIIFDWTDVAAPAGISAYELFVIGPNATIPLVNRFVTASEFAFISCNAFVADRNLRGWQWRVRSLDSQGVLGVWSPTRIFHFAPCRLPNSSPCFAS